jgi:uncharacterized protein (DUF1810 family)
MEYNGMTEPYGLQRFVDAQDSVYERVCAELRSGYKREHWIWFIFPQMKGLGHSAQSRMFGISSKVEAEAYQQHPVLGPRLRECTSLVLAIQGRSITEILGEIDALKFRSSMTLFAHATPDNQIFKDALEKYFEGEFDDLTLEKLQSSGFAET